MKAKITKLDSNNLEVKLKKSLAWRIFGALIPIPILTSEVSYSFGGKDYEYNLLAIEAAKQQLLAQKAEEPKETKESDEKEGDE